MNKALVGWRVALALALGLAASPPDVGEARQVPAQPADFSAWHLPLPRGEWRISRGACASSMDYRHDCDYYEDQCALDLIPASGRMTGVPVLAPYPGQVFFLGTRDDAGLTVMLRHPDGRVSAFMHLSQVAVGLDQAVAQGEVLGYAGGTGSSGQPHLHFFVQPNAVERRCLDLTGLDLLDYRRLSAVSGNLAWTELTLPDPPRLPEWLPRLSLPDGVVRAIAPRGLALEPGSRAAFPLALPAAVVQVPVNAPARLGIHWLEPPLGATRRPLRLEVRPAPDTRPAAGLMAINPQFVSPAGFARLRQAPQLCWSLAPQAGQAPVAFRVLVAGPGAADSGWIGETCWQAPELPAGTYYWKVFARDALGHMNRTNQRPAAFVIH